MQSVSGKTSTKNIIQSGYAGLAPFRKSFRFHHVCNNDARKIYTGGVVPIGDLLSFVGGEFPEISTGEVPDINKTARLFHMPVSKMSREETFSRASATFSVSAVLGLKARDSLFESWGIWGLSNRDPAIAI